MNIPPRFSPSVAKNVRYLFCITLVGILYVSISPTNVAVQAFVVVPTPSSSSSTATTTTTTITGTKAKLLGACNCNAFLHSRRTSLISGSSSCSSSCSSTSTSNNMSTLIRMMTPSLGSVSISSLSSPSSPSYGSNSGTCTRLYAAPQKRIARRDMKKRPNRRGRRSGNSVGPTSTSSSSSSSSAQKTSNNIFQTNNNNNSLIVESELRPLVRAKKVEAGEDYWIDEVELQKSLDRKIALKNRKANEGEISKEKLRTEVVAPYKQNWIGLFSVLVVVLATIVTNFPELLNSPVIQIPDL